MLRASAFHREDASDDRWLHEIKFDGCRVQLHIANEDIKVFTRRGNDWTKRFKKIAVDAYLINANSVIIDGEIVVPAADGITASRTPARCQATINKRREPTGGRASLKPWPHKSGPWVSRFDVPLFVKAGRWPSEWIFNDPHV